MINGRAMSLGFLLLVLVPRSAWGQQQPDPATVHAAQRDAMAALTFMDGTWRGSAWTLLQTGERHEITQTERVGPFLDGALKVIEGRGYEADGRSSFNAFAIISYDVGKRAYAMRSYAMGRVGDFAFTPTSDGFVWEIPVGTMTIRYTAVIRDGTWHEVGDRIMPGQDTIRFHEMRLTRLGDTDWPAAGTVRP